MILESTSSSSLMINSHRIQNQTTPSSRRHVNEQPTEILRLIFLHYCDFDRSPLLLQSVCSLWRAIIKDFPALWSFITYTSISGPRENLLSDKVTRGPGQVCYCWEEVAKAITYAVGTPITMSFRIRPMRTGYPSPTPLPEMLRNRCRMLRVTGEWQTDALMANIGILPILEHLEMRFANHVRAGTFLETVQIGSPRLRSLDISRGFPHGISRFEALLGRLTRLKLQIPIPYEFQAGLIEGLKHLAELVLHADILVPALAFPNLTSLTIWGARLRVAGSEPVQLPKLETLALVGFWEDISLISAPKLTRLTLKKASGSQDNYISELLAATARPTILTIDDSISGEYLVQLLRGPWSNLRELHIVSGAYRVCPDPVATAALAGSEGYLPLCLCLGVLTITVDVYGKGDRAVVMLMLEPFICNLKTIVDRRNGREAGKLRQATCFWSFPAPHTSIAHNQELKETEWVDLV